MVKIVVLDEGKTIKEVTAGQDTYVLGRHDSCDIMLEDKTISRQHARLEFKDGEAFVEEVDADATLRRFFFQLGEFCANTFFFCF